MVRKVKKKHQTVHFYEYAIGMLKSVKQPEVCATVFLYYYYYYCTQKHMQSHFTEWMEKYWPQ